MEIVWERGLWEEDMSGINGGYGEGCQRLCVAVVSEDRGVRLRTSTMTG